MNTYEHGLEILAGRDRRTIATATTITRDPDGAIRWTYRGTDVVIALPDGSIVLDTGGWPTRTTQRRMNDALKPLGLGVVGSTLQRGVLPRVPKRWAVVRIGAAYGTKLGTVEYFEDHGEGVRVDTGTNWITGRQSWGSNISGVARQVAHI